MCSVIQGESKSSPFSTWFTNMSKIVNGVTHDEIVEPITNYADSTRNLLKEKKKKYCVFIWSPNASGDSKTKVAGCIHQLYV